MTKKVKLKQISVKTIATFDNTLESKILDAGNILILLNLQNPGPLLGKMFLECLKLNILHSILNRSKLCECSLTAGNYLLNQTDTNCRDMPELEMATSPLTMPSMRLYWMSSQ